jgi:hypothetical protein
MACLPWLEGVVGSLAGVPNTRADRSGDKQAEGGFDTGRATWLGKLEQGVGRRPAVDGNKAAGWPEGKR